MLVNVIITYAMFYLPQISADVVVPEDVTIWGGLSLAVIFRVVVVPALMALGLLKDDNKKTVGGYLIAAGVLVAGIYTLLTAKISDPFVVLTNLAAGGFAGIGAVGLHSTQKNLLEYFKAKKK